MELDLSASIEARKAMYRAHGISYYRSWIVMCTDGYPTDDWRPAAKALAKAERDKQVAAFFIGVDGADFGAAKDCVTGSVIRRCEFNGLSLVGGLGNNIIIVL